MDDVQRKQVQNTSTFFRRLAKAEIDTVNIEGAASTGQVLINSSCGLFKQVY